MIYALLKKDATIAEGKNCIKNKKGSFVFRNSVTAKKFFSHFMKKNSEYSIFEIEASWNEDTIPSTEYYNILIKDSKIVKKIL